METSNVVQTVDENKIGYTKQQVERAEGNAKRKCERAEAVSNLYHIVDHQQWKHSRQC